MKVYKNRIDFTDRIQKDNYKWVEHFVKYQSKKHPDEDIEWFLKDLLDIHEQYLNTRKLPKGIIMRE